VPNETFNDNRCGIDVRIADSFMLNEQDFAETHKLEIRETQLITSLARGSRSSSVALQQTRDMAGEIIDPRTPLLDEANAFTVEIKARLDAANKTVDDVFAKQARVHLLFADSSPTTMASVGVTAHL
jgi:hypothetical protein